MQASHRAHCGRQRVVVLYELSIHTQVCIYSTVVGFRKEPPIIAKTLRFQQLYAL